MLCIHKLVKTKCKYYIGSTFFLQLFQQIVLINIMYCMCDVAAGNKKSFQSKSSTRSNKKRFLTTEMHLVHA